VANVANVSIPVGCDIHINILEAIQMYSAATTANCFHKAGIVLQDTRECEK